MKSKTIQKEIQKRHQVPMKWNPETISKKQHRYKSLLKKKPKEYDKYDNLKSYDKYDKSKVDKIVDKKYSKYMKQ